MRKTPSISRRRFLGTAAATGVAVAAGPSFPALSGEVRPRRSGAPGSPPEFRGRGRRRADARQRAHPHDGRAKHDRHHGDAP